MIHADVITYEVGLLQQSLSLTDRDELFLSSERQQLMKTPNPTETNGIGPFAPRCFEFSQTRRNCGSVPLVVNIEQISTLSHEVRTLLAS